MNECSNQNILSAGRWQKYINPHASLLMKIRWWTLWQKAFSRWWFQADWLREGKTSVLHQFLSEACKIHMKLMERVKIEVDCWFFSKDKDTTLLYKHSIQFSGLKSVWGCSCVSFQHGPLLQLKKKSTHKCELQKCRSRLSMALLTWGL